jgi:hypothetical protein
MQHILQGERQNCNRVKAKCYKYFKETERIAIDRGQNATYIARRKRTAIERRQNATYIARRERIAIERKQNATHCKERENFTDLVVFMPYLLVPPLQVSHRQGTVL